MGMNAHQKEQVDISISFLLDLPTDEVELENAINELYQALISEDLIENNPYSPLRKILDTPESYIFHLEETTSTNDTLYIQDVQRYIIEYISAKVTEAEKRIKNKINLWDEVTLLKKYELDISKKIPFITKQSLVTNHESALPAWQICTTESGSVFSAHLSTEASVPITAACYWHALNSETRLFFSRIGDKETIPFLPWIYLNINIPDIAGKSWIDTLPLMPLFMANQDGLRYRFFPTDTEQDQFIEGLLVDGLRQARKLASLYILTILLNKDLTKSRAIIREKITAEGNLFADLNINEATQIVITNTHYSTSLIERRYQLDDFINISPEQAAFFIHPSIISLLSNRVMSNHDVKDLTQASFNVVTNPYYYALLKNKSVRLNLLRNLSEKQARMLTSPPMICLLKENKLSIRTVKSLSQHAIKLFANNFYQRKLSQEDVDWEYLVSLSSSDVTTLLSPAVMQFMFECYDKFPDYCLSNLFALLPTIKLILGTNQLNELIQSKKLSLHDALTLSGRIRYEIEHHPFLAYWIQSKLISVDILHEKAIQKIEQRAVTIITGRINAILDKKPLVVRHSTQHHFVDDSIDLINQDIETLASYQHTDLSLLLKPIIINIFALLKQKLVSFKPKDENSYVGKFSKLFLDTINSITENSDKTDQYWEDQLTYFLEMTRSLLNKLTQNENTPHFFQPKTPLDEFISLCETFLILKNFMSKEKIDLQLSLNQ